MPLPLVIDNLDLLFSCISIVELLGVLGNDEIVFSTDNEESRNKGFLHVLQGVEGLDFKAMLNYIAITSFLMVPEIMLIAAETNIPGIFECRAANSRASCSKLLKGESSTSPAIDGSLSEYISAVTAPMLLPHSPIVDTLLEFLR